MTPEEQQYMQYQAWKAQQAKAPQGGSGVAGIGNAIGSAGGYYGANSLMSGGTAEALTAGGADAAGIPAFGIGATGDSISIGAGTGTAPLAPTGIGAAGNFVLPAAGAIGAYDVLGHNYGPGRSGLEGAASGAAMGSYFGPQGALIGAGIGGGVGLVKGFMKHETTREHAHKDTQAMLGKNGNDAAYQNYVKGMRAQYEGPPPDPKHPFHGGQYATWDQYKQAGLDAGDLTGVKGNIDTFGANWAHLNEDQRKAVTQKMIEAGLYDSKRGEVEVTDPVKAQQIYAEMEKGGFKGAPAAAVPAKGAPAAVDAVKQYPRGVAAPAAPSAPSAMPVRDNSLANNDKWVNGLPPQNIIPSKLTPNGQKVVLPDDLSHLLNGLTPQQGASPAGWNQAPLPNSNMANAMTNVYQQNRSQTRSPGIDKNGNRINYSRR